MSRLCFTFAPRALVLLCLAAALLAQTTPAKNSAATAVPTMVQFGGTVKGATSRLIGITFALYKDQDGGAPLWLETQSVALDASGHYSVQLGVTLTAGLPRELFASGEARWLGVQPEGQSEQPRILLLSVPYALKAADAETIGGLPPSAFVLATPSPSATNPTANAATGSNPSSLAPPPNAAVTGLGTINFLPLWDTTSDIVNSAVSQTGTGTTAKVGINTTAPTTTLDVKGTATVRGAFSLPTIAPATSTAGKNSQPMNQVASSFNSSTNAAVNQTFRWQAEATGNNTANPSGTLNLLFGSGTTTPAETGLKIGPNGQITFATGQSFPGAGTISGVTAGSGLTGGGTSGNVTLNLDATKIPLLNVSNTFTGNQTVSGNLSATGTVSGSSFQIGSTLFAFGSTTSGNSFLGFSGNTTTTGTQTTAIGAGALGLNTTGSFNAATGNNALADNTSGGSNTAIGGAALESNTTGNSNTATGAFALISNTTASNNTATGGSALGGTTTGGNNTGIGYFTLVNNTTGSNNTALGYNAGPDSFHPDLTNTTALGANAVVTASNAMVLGGTGGNAVNVGIGTTAPAFTLDVHGTGNFTGPITFASSQTFPGTGTITGVSAGTALSGGGTTGNVTLNVDTTKVLTGVTAGTGLTGGGVGGLQTLSVDTTKVVTGITVGTGLTGGGTGGVQNLSLDTTKVPQLGAANTFTVDQTVKGNLTATGFLSGSALALNGQLFAFGTYFSDDAYVGFAGNLTSTGTFNTGTGISALYSNTTGSYNTANGAFALVDNTTGGSNTAIGHNALYGNTTGSFNTATGELALALNSTGASNTAAGYQALYSSTTASNNTAVGYQALLNNTTGYSNAANGYLALSGNTTGDSNTASGQQALYTNTTGEGNTGTGFTALYSNAAGVANTADGYGALYYAAGNFNSGLGYAAGPDKTTPGLTNSTAIGSFADVTASNAMVLGSINGVGFGTADTLVGINITAPTSLLHIGNRGNTKNSLRVEGPAKSGSGGMAASFGGYGDFGIDAPGIAEGRFVVKESGSVGIGTASPDNLLSVNGSADKVGGGSWGTFSDGRLKTIGRDFTAGLDEVLKLHPIHYRYKEENAMGIRDHADHVGFVAQDVQKVIPDAVSENSRGYLLVNNDPILWAMLNAIQQQQKQIQQQQQQIVRLSHTVGTLDAALRAAKSQARSLSVRPQPVKAGSLSTR